MIVPDNLFIQVDVFQYHVPKIVTLPTFPFAEAANETTKWLQRQLSLGNTRLIISAPQESQVLRLLRHVREEVEGIKLQPKNLVFYFDTPNSLDMVTGHPTEDGDLDCNVPGGLFTYRATEIF